MGITLRVNGREREFSNEMLRYVLEKYLSEEATKQITLAKMAQVPTEGKFFKVNPLEIDRRKFEKSRRDPRQEKTRQFIQRAFASVDQYPEKYESTFYTLIPEKNWNEYKDGGELEAYANKLGGMMADWVEQALEWAQRICNGESWKAICNNADTAKWYRMILWELGQYRMVGGSSNEADDNPASDISEQKYNRIIMFGRVVPLVVFRKK